jgi:crotonobetaine/carnitine-CoA ligase
MLTSGARHFGDRPLFRCGSTAWTYAETVDVASRMAGRLAATGIRPGDRVAILSGNRAEVMQVLLGCGWLGAIAVPINIAVKAPQLRYYLADSGARVLVAAPDLLDALPQDAFADLALERIWALGAPARNRPGLVDFDGRGDPVPPGDIGPGTPFAILYTSGTTGPAKGVVCPHAQFYWWGVYSSRFLDVTADDVLATTLPLFHTNAINCLFQALLHGASQVVLPRFSASGFWSAMIETQATVGYVLGAMVPILLAQPVSSLERGHCLRVALGPGVPASLHDALFDRTGVRLVDGFGSTESNFVIGDIAEARVAGRMGRLSEGITARIADDNDAAVPDGEPGELLLRADHPHVFASGYFGRPEATIAAWRNLWFHTGDRVIRHADGTFAFVDRLKDVIRRRGENISSFEVEQVLQSHPGIEVAAVYPVPSDLAEDEVMAAVVVKPGVTLSAGEIIAHCAANLPKFAVPRFIDVVPELPRTENGKVQKFRLRAIGVTAATFDAQAQ